VLEAEPGLGRGPANGRPTVYSPSASSKILASTWAFVRAEYPPPHVELIVISSIAGNGQAIWQNIRGV